MTELHKLTTYDGVEYTFDPEGTQNPTRLVLVPSPGNWGIPPLNIITERNYKQDGDTVVAQYLNPRQFELSFRLQGCSRAEFWEMREALLNICRPNRGGAVTYTHYRADNSKRSIKGTAISPTFPAIDPDIGDQWGIDDALQLICHDPVWWNPDEITPEIVHTEPDPNLIFSFAFPVDSFFGAGVDMYTATITYTPSWYAFPVFVVHGQARNLTLQHRELEIQIVLQGDISTNETVTIDIQNRTAVSDINGSVWSRLWVGSNVVDFKIQPTPIVSGGVNHLDVVLDNKDANTEVEITYLERWVGI